jgi:hypothetical protein
MTTRIFAYALLMLLLPSAAWAHRCGAQTLEVKKGNTVDFVIIGDEYIEYQIVDKGDPLVAKIEPPKNEESTVVFKIVGAGNGVTSFKINWYGPSRLGTCRVNVTVGE